MKRNLALNHVLLVQARRLAALAAHEGGDEARERAIGEVIRSLRVDVDHRVKAYVVQVAIAGKDYRHEAPEADFDFYRRGDTAAAAGVEQSAGAREVRGEARDDARGEARGAARGEARDDARRDSRDDARDDSRGEDSASAVNARAARALLVTMLTAAGVAVPEAWADPDTVAPLALRAEAMPWSAVGIAALVAAVGAARGYSLSGGLYAAFTVVSLAGLLRGLALPPTGVWQLAAIPAVAAWFGCTGHPGALGAFAFSVASVHAMLVLEERRYVPGVDALAGWICALPLAFDHTVGAVHVAWTVLLIGAGAYLAPWVFELRRAVTLCGGLFIGSIGVYGDVAPATAAGGVPAGALAFAALTWLALGLPHWFFGVHRGAVRLLLPVWALALSLALYRTPARCGAIELSALLALAAGAVARIHGHLKTGTVPDPLPETRGSVA